MAVSTDALKVFSTVWILQHAVAELYHGCGAKPMEGGDGSVARDPIGDGSAWYRNAMFRRYAARGLFLRMAEVGRVLAR